MILDFVRALLWVRLGVMLREPKAKRKPTDKVIKPSSKKPNTNTPADPANRSRDDVINGSNHSQRHKTQDAILASAPFSFAQRRQRRAEQKIACV